MVSTIRPMWVKKFMAPKSRKAAPAKAQLAPMMVRISGTLLHPVSAKGKRTTPTPTRAKSVEMKMASTSGQGAKRPEIGSCGGVMKSWYVTPAMAIPNRPSPIPKMNTDISCATFRIS